MNGDRQLNILLISSILAAIITATSACSTLRGVQSRNPASKAHLQNGKILAAQELNPAIDICVQRMDGFLGREFTQDQKQALCQSASLDEPAAPLMCFEKSSEVIPGVTLTDDQRIQLCAGVAVEPMAPIDCVEEAETRYGTKVSAMQKIKLCSGAPEQETSPLTCFERSEFLLRKKLSTDQKVALCSGAADEGLQPLQCFSRADSLKGSRLSDQDKILICGKNSG